MSDIDYWKEAVSIGAEECGAELTAEQILGIAESVQGSHENYSLCFYRPSASDRVESIESEWKAKYHALEKEMEKRERNAEEAIRRKLNLHTRTRVSIGEHGKVFIEP